MRIFVIGGTGFIGPHVVRALGEAGHAVAVFHRGRRTGALPRGVTSIVGDRQQMPAHARQLRAFAPDVVIDMVLSSGAQAQALLDVVAGVVGRVVGISSMDVYRAAAVLHGLDDGPLQSVPLTEESELRHAAAVYPAAQLEALKQVFGWLDAAYDKTAVERVLRNDPRIAATILRLPMVYGPGDPLHRLFPLVKRMDDGRPAIVMPASVAAWRSPRGYVENVADAIALVATSRAAAGRTYHVAEPEDLSELELAEQVARVTGWRGRVVVVPDERAPAHLRMPGNLAQHWAAESTRIRRELGFDERVDRGEALRRTVAWERGHPPAQVDASRFDYAAEDAALADARR